MGLRTEKSANRLQAGVRARALCAHLVVAMFVVAGAPPDAWSAPRAPRAPRPAPAKPKPADASKAEPPLDKAERKRALGFYRQAEADMAANRWAEAKENLDQVLAIKETAAVRYHRGVCNAKLNNWVAAYDDYRRALALSARSKDPDDKQLAAESRRSLDDVKQHTAEVAVVARPVSWGEKPTIRVDGTPLSEDQVPGNDGSRVIWGPFRLVKGEHQVEVRLEGREPLSRSFVLPSASTGEQEGVELVVLTWPEPVDPPPPNEAPRAPAAAAERPRTLELRPESPKTPAYLGGAAIALGAVSAGLLGAQLAWGSADGQSGPSYLGLGLVTGGAALASGALALAFGAAAAVPAAPAARAPGAPRAPQRARFDDSTKNTLGLIGTHFVLAPSAQGAAFGWAGVF